MKTLQENKVKQLLVTVLLTGALIFFGVHHFFMKTPGRLEMVTSYAVYPFLFVQQKVIQPFKQYRQRKKDQKDLYKNFLKLQEKNADLQARITELEASKYFKETTKELVAFQKKYQTDDALLSQIIFKRLSDNEQIVFVNQGSNHGVVKDMVAVYKNNLLGKVIQVFPTYSQVMLVTDKRCNVSVYCSWIKTKGILQGANTGDYLKLTHVDRLKKLRKKELIISSGEGTVFPQGFRLGTVESFEPDGVHYKVTVSPSVDIESLKYCYLLRKGAQATS